MAAIVIHTPANGEPVLLGTDKDKWVQSIIREMELGVNVPLGTVQKATIEITFIADGRKAGNGDESKADAPAETPAPEAPASE